MQLHSLFKIFSTRSSDCVKSPSSINFTGDVSIYTSWHSGKCSYCPWRERDRKCWTGTHWEIDYCWQQKRSRMKFPSLFSILLLNADPLTNATNLSPPTSSRLVSQFITYSEFLRGLPRPFQGKSFSNSQIFATKLHQRSLSIHPWC